MIKIHSFVVMGVSRNVVLCLLVTLVLLAGVKREKSIERVTYFVAETLPQPGDDQLLPIMRRPLTSEGDFYRRLSTNTGRCGRLVSLGGLGCLRRLEGNKYICADAAVAPSFGRCLLYSFGVAYDTNFERDLWYFLRCSMFLFDPTVEKEDVEETPPIKWHFDQLGLSNQSGWRTMASGRYKLPARCRLQPFHVIREALGHQDTTIDFLKMDIEGEEWRVLPSLVRSGALATIHQIAMEIHTNDISELPQDQWLGVLQERYDTLMLLEDHGFRRVHAENNTLLVSYLQLPGLDKPTPSCMELLYVKI